MPFFAARRAREVQDKGTTRSVLYPPARNVTAFLTESKPNVPRGDTWRQRQKS